MINPKIRFKKSDGSDYQDWKHTNLGLCCSIKTGKLDANAAVENGQYKFFTCAREDSTIDKYSFEGKSIIIAGNGDVGHTKLYDGKFDAYQRTYVLQDFTDNDYILKTAIDKHLPKQIAVELQGSTMPYIKLSTLTDLDINIPIDNLEQIKIANFLSEIDNLIASAEHEVKSTKQLKKAMLQKMFPKKGEKVPEIRFPEFTDDWEQRKVSDLLQERNEQAPMDEEYPLMAFIANQGVAPKGERYDRSALVNDEAGKKYKRTEYGDFIYSSNNLETGSIGLNKYGNACISPVYSIFKPTGKADLDFLGRRFLRKDFINEMVKWRQGVVYGQWKIHESDFLKIEIAVPSIDEQKAIGQYFDNLDNLITLHQRKVDTYKKFKKSMMQKIFL